MKVKSSSLLLSVAEARGGIAKVAAAGAKLQKVMIRRGY